MSANISPKTVAVADQEYAEVNKAVNQIITVLRQGLESHPEYAGTPSVAWYLSARDYHEAMAGELSARERDRIHCNTADIMIAACFRLAHEGLAK